MEQEYIKIRLDFKYAEKGRFYRVLLIKKGMSLFEMGLHFVAMLGGEMEHCFLYRKKKLEFVQASFLEDFDEPCWDWMEFYSLEELGPEFEFDYDTGDGWDFKAKVYKKPVFVSVEDEDEIAPAIFLEGAGQGIWEDHIGTLYAYFDGELDPNAPATEDEEKGIYPPWNHLIERWGDFDKPLDPEEHEYDYFYGAEEFIKEEHDCAAELGITEPKKDFGKPRDPIDGMWDELLFRGLVRLSSYAEEANNPDVAEELYNRFLDRFALLFPKEKIDELFDGGNPKA